jgi:hypothetical protein
MRSVQLYSWDAKFLDNFEFNTETCINAGEDTNGPNTHSDSPVDKAIYRGG